MAADRFSLRVKLVGAVLALVTCALSVMAVATVTALRRYLIGRLDAQITVVCAQLQHEIDAGVEKYTVPLPDVAGGSLHLPTPFVLETVDPDATVHDAWPTYPPPANVPQLTSASLARTQPFIASSKTDRWRVRVLSDGTGGHVVVMANMSDVDRAVGRLAGLTVLVGLAILIAMAALSVWLVRTSLRPLVEIEGTATEIAGGDLSLRVPERGTRTEVGRLGHAFNVMIERIEYALGRALRSEERMRQFAADASHELRTPLTTIRGFAELYRQGAVRDPEGTSRLLRRIEDEARRMSLLVDDLLLLARLDQRRPLASAPVDLAVLAADAVEDAHAMAPDRPVALSLPDGGSAMVTGDEERLRQVLRNLVTNALTHTPPDASVTVRVARAEQHVVLEVTDTGPGLDPEQRQRVFERFYRADPARGRPDSATGTGLGLAIVAAIAAAHAGTVEVDSEPGKGATFRLTLPAA